MEKGMTNTDEACRIYNGSVVIDGLNVSNWDSPAVFQSLSSGGTTAINATIATWENFQETLAHIASWGGRFEQYKGTLLQVRTVDDIARAKREGLVGVILGFQNASPIENRLERLALFHGLGVRIIQVTYHERNLLGNGCYERRDDGLSNFGIDAVREMNRLGILVDLSHVGERTTLETIEVSEKPVAVTHANSKAYYDVRRNKAEDAVKLLAGKGGVVGATCITSFLKTGPSSTLNDYVDAIDNLVELIGIDHVGIGTDFTQDQPESFWLYIASQQGTKYPNAFTDPSRSWGVNDPALYPAELQTPDDFPNLASALVGRGYTAEDTSKILGGNWLRLFREVWVD
jgi:membrane dipeptidase